jgi:hypothetical protein
MGNYKCAVFYAAVVALLDGSDILINFFREQAD